MIVLIAIANPVKTVKRVSVTRASAN